MGVQFTGTRPMTYAWYHNGALMTDDEDGRITGLGTYTIEISDLRITDGGFYYCTATNACGEHQQLRGRVAGPVPSGFQL